MKFRDDKIVRVDKYTFEHARLVQGAMEWSFFIILSVIGLITGETKLAIIILAVIFLAFMCSVAYYILKIGKFNAGVKVGVYRLLSAVSSMIA